MAFLIYLLIQIFYPCAMYYFLKSKGKSTKYIVWSLFGVVLLSFCLGGLAAGAYLSDDAWFAWGVVIVGLGSLGMALEKYREQQAGENQQNIAKPNAEEKIQAVLDENERLKMKINYLEKSIKTLNETCQYKSEVILRLEQENAALQQKVTDSINQMRKKQAQLKAEKPRPMPAEMRQDKSDDIAEVPHRTICFAGFKTVEKSKLIQQAQRQNFHIAQDVAEGLDFLVIDPNSNLLSANKLMLAKEYGVQVLDKEEFEALVANQKGGALPATLGTQKI